MLSCLSLLCLHILTFILATLTLFLGLHWWRPQPSMVATSAFNGCYLCLQWLLPQPSMVATSAFIACYLNFHANHLKIPQHIYGVRYHKTSILYKPLPRLSVLSTNYFVNNFE